MSWGRNTGSGQINPQLFTGMGQMGGQSFVGQGMGMSGGMSMGGGIMPLNTAAFGQQGNVGMSYQRSGGGQSGGSTQKQRAFIGTVTKMQDNYGFVDDDVFFQIAVVKGPVPRIGERVMAEATYNPNMPFKWNASRIQVLPGGDEGHHGAAESGTAGRREGRADYGGRGGGGGGGGGGASGRDTGRNRSPAGRRRQRSPAGRRRSKSPHQRSSAARHERDRDSVRGATKRGRDRSSERSKTREGAGGSRHDSSTRSPPRRRMRVVPRYSISVPRVALDVMNVGGADAHRRYPHMYVPSDFFNADYRWQTVFPVQRSFSLDREAVYHIMPKDVEPLSVAAKDAILNPPDADYRYSAKVMLMAAPGLKEIQKKCLCMDGDGVVDIDSHDYQPVPVGKIVSFLVGLKGKSEHLAIGGPWSPSLDGNNPDTDPRVLINTAIRTALALTGVDLSKCTQWYKFLEVHYRRVDKEKPSQTPSDTTEDGVGGGDNAEGGGGAAGGGSLPSVTPRIETVVIFIPDVWNIVPTQTEFEEIKESLKKSLEEKIAALEPPPTPPPEPILETPSTEPGADDTTTKDTSESQDDKPSAMDTTTSEEAPAATADKAEIGGGGDGEGKDSADDGGTGQAKHTEEAKESEAEPTGADDDANTAKDEESAKNADEEMEKEKDDQEESAAGDEKTASTPTNWSKLDLKTMKVAELRGELEARGLESKGIKTQLVQRLQKALKTEQEEEEKGKTSLEDGEEEDDGQDEEAKEEARKQKELEAKKEEERKRKELEEKKRELEEKRKEAERLEREKRRAEEAAKRKAEQDERERQKKKEKEEKERKEKAERLERHYQLTSTIPGILVHPSPTAKSGKFDCHQLPLKTLMDYRSLDNKEHSFEVALFAETFNEMLTRDAAFDIYKAIISIAPEKPKKKEVIDVEAPAADDTESVADPDVKPKEDAEPEAEKAEEKMDTDTESPKKAASKDSDVEIIDEGGDLTISDEVKEDTEADQAVKEDKAQKSDDKDKETKKDDKTSKPKEVEKEKTGQYVVKDTNRLMSFTYFDVGHVHYINESDLEDIVNLLGMRMSRSQVSKIVRKALDKKNVCSYRRFTDVHKYKDGSEGELPEPLKLPPGEEVILGNKCLPTGVDSAIAPGDGSKPAIDSAVPDLTDKPSVIYQGSVVDLRSVLQQLNRLEREQKATQWQNFAYEKEIVSSKEKIESLDKKKCRLDEDLKETKKKLCDTQESLRASQREAGNLKNSLIRSKDIAENVVRVVDRALPPPPKKEEKKPEPAKSESSKATDDDDAPKVIELDDDTGKSPAAKKTSGVNGVVPSVEIGDELPEGDGDLAVVTDEVVENDKPEADMDTA